MNRRRSQSLDSSRRGSYSVITDSPDSNRFHRLLLFDYASVFNEPGRCDSCDGTQVAVRREQAPEVVPKEDRSARGAWSRELTAPIVESVPSGKSVMTLVSFVRVCP